MADIDVPDLNLWLALADPDHAHHARARRYWEAEAASGLAFCRVTMLGMLRLLTNPRVMHGTPLSPAEAWDAYRAFTALPEVCFLGEASLVEQTFAEWTGQPDFAAHRWTDAWIAATAHAHAARVVSFDRDFTTFSPLDFLHLTP